MKRLTTLAMAVLLAASTTVSMAGQAFADSIGTVNYEKLIRSYSKAQAFADDREIKENDLETTRAEYVKQLREAKKAQANNPVAIEQLEKKLQGQLDTKIQSTRDWVTSRSRELEGEMNNAIKSVAQTKQLDTVVAQQFVFYGGTDITNDVLGILNKPASAAAPAPAKK